MKFVEWFMGYALVWVLIAACAALLALLIFLLWSFIQDWRDTHER